MNANAELGILPMAGASDAMKNYEKLTGDARSKDLAKVWQELDQESKAVTQETRETFSPTVSDWWGRVHKWL